MPTVHVEAELSVEELLKAVEQLSPPDLEAFTRRVLMLQALRQAPGAAQDEEALLRLVQRRLPDDLQQRYDELIAKRRAETLTPEEYEELLRLTDEVEAHNTRRVESLVKLALRRSVTVDELMKDLDLRWPEDA